MKYWSLKDEGYSTEQIREMFSDNIESLASSGGFYTVSQLANFTKVSFYTVKKYFVSCYDEGLIQSKIDSFCHSQKDWSCQSILDFLNTNEYYSKTGKPWTLSSFNRTSLTIPRTKKIHQRHLEIWKHFDSNRHNFKSYNHAVKFLNQRKIYQESGKPWSRQLLSLIIQKYPELDWSLPNRSKSKSNMYTEKYNFLDSSVFEKYSSFEEMIKVLKLPKDQAMMAYLTSLNICKRGWQQYKNNLALNRIMEITAENPQISYSDLWNQLSDYEGFPSQAKRKCQRMYNYMKKHNILDYKRNKNEQQSN